MRRAPVFVGILPVKHLSFYLLLVFFSLTAHADQGRPEWIWTEKGDRFAPGKVRLSDRVRIDTEIKRADLKVTTDFARARVLIGDKAVVELEPYDPPVTVDVKKFMKQEGGNQIVVELESVQGPSAFASELVVEFRDEDLSPLLHRSGDHWKGAKSFGTLIPQRWNDNRLSDISPFAEYNQWKEALPGDEKSDALKGIGPLPEGFEIDLVHSATADEGSWVSMCFDDMGRIIIAREDKGLLRGTVPKPGDPLELELVNDSLEECRGLVWKDGALFANANDSKALYRLRDTSGDDQFDEVILLRATEGSVGHGRNDLAMGPDGMIHAIHGDSVKIPEKAKRLTVSEPDGSTELGYWSRTDKDGKTWEVRARGLRNPYGIDFNRDGEAFTYDADNEGDVGLPFYRPTRINHLVSGANYGWHQQWGNTRSLPVYAPDTVPTTFDVGRGSPTAVKFGTRSNFPYPWKDALFALDWAYGRIVVVHLVPRGASYYASGEVFLEGRPLNVTDLDFDADGSMLFVTGGRKTKSDLYRVRYVGDPLSPPKKTIQQKEREAFSANARKKRKQGTDLSLGDPDPWIRNAARVALEKNTGESPDTDNSLGKLTALLASARVDSKSRNQTAIKALGLADQKLNRTEKLTLLRICELAKPVFTIDVAMKMMDSLDPWLPDISDPVNRELCRVLVPLGSQKAVGFSSVFHSNATDQLERLHYLEVLADAPFDTSFTGEGRTVFFRQLGEAKRLSQGDRFMGAFFEKLEKTALEKISIESERENLAESLAAAAKPIAEKDTPPPVPRRFVQHWSMKDFPDADLAAPRKPDLARGKAMYAAALCNRCHVCGNEGRSVGPDLTQVGHRFSRRDLLLSIIEPSQVVAEVHRNVIITRKDGSTVTGRVAFDDFRKSLLSIASNPFAPDDLTEVSKTDIESFEESPVSPMPPALLDTLSKDEILDLLVWMESGGTK